MREKFGARLASRTKRVAAKSIAAIPAEAVPFIGVAVLIADTGYELAHRIGNSYEESVT